MKILVVLFRTLGDILMGTTVLRAIKEKYPDSEIDFATERKNFGILKGNPDVNKCIPAKSYFEANMIAAEGNYDKVYRLNMATHEDTCWHHIPEHQNQHLVEWYAKRADIQELKDKNVYVYLDNNDQKNIDKVFDELPFKDNIVVIHTSSGAHDVNGSNRVESKDWPIDYFNVLADNLIREGYNVVQIGVTGDKVIECEGVVNLLNKLQFKQIGGFLKKCKAYIGVDSGPSYLAGWSGIPSMVIMGATQGWSEDYKGPTVGPRTDNITYIHPKRPENPACDPVPCYTQCQIKFQHPFADVRGFSCVHLMNTDDMVKNFKKMMEKP